MIASHPKSVCCNVCPQCPSPHTHPQQTHTFSSGHARTHALPRPRHHKLGATLSLLMQITPALLKRQALSLLMGARTCLVGRMYTWEWQHTGGAAGGAQEQRRHRVAVGGPCTAGVRPCGTPVARRHALPVVVPHSARAHHQPLLRATCETSLLLVDST